MKTCLELAKLFKNITFWSTVGTDTQYKIIHYDETWNEIPAEV